MFQDNCISERVLRTGGSEIISGFKPNRVVFSRFASFNTFQVARQSSVHLVCASRGEYWYFYVKAKSISYMRPRTTQFATDFSVHGERRGPFPLLCHEARHLLSVAPQEIKTAVRNLLKRTQYVGVTPFRDRGISSHGGLKNHLHTSLRIVRHREAVRASRLQWETIFRRHCNVVNQ